MQKTCDPNGRTIFPPVLAGIATGYIIKGVIQKRNKDIMFGVLVGGIAAFVRYNCG